MVVLLMVIVPIIKHLLNVLQIVHVSNVLLMMTVILILVNLFVPRDYAKHVLQTMIVLKILSDKFVSSLFFSHFFR